MFDEAEHQGQAVDLDNEDRLLRVTGRGDIVIFSMA